MEIRLEHSIYLATFFAWIVNALLQRVSNFWFYSIISLPGTFLHELAHFIVGFVLGARPTSFSIFPKKTETHWVFGSVGFYNINSFNALPTTMAPLLILLFPSAVFMFIDFNDLEWYMLLVTFIGIALISHSAIPSGQDFKVLFSRPLGLVLYILIGYYFFNF